MFLSCYTRGLTFLRQRPMKLSAWCFYVYDLLIKSLEFPCLLSLVLGILSSHVHEKLETWFSVILAWNFCTVLWRWRPNFPCCWRSCCSVLTGIFVLFSFEIRGLTFPCCCSGKARAWFSCTVVWRKSSDVFSFFPVKIKAFQCCDPHIGCPATHLTNVTTEMSLGLIAI
jgi:hypothetical protein